MLAAAPQSLELKRVGIVVGESSGDILGAGLMRELKKRFPDCQFEGVGGPQMLAEGFTSLYKMDRLAVMGLFEPLKRLPELLRMRRELRRHFVENPPDIFIGIDAPDFNLTLEQRIRESGVTTAHYVSPSVWAWRQKRVFKVAKAVDLMLTLFPFEARFYEEHGIPVAFVGHTLADAIPMRVDVQQSREKLGLTDTDKNYVALLPGSRAAEVRMLGRIFCEAAQLCLKQRKNLHFLIPAANQKRLEQLKEILSDFPELPVSLFTQQSHDVMAAADALVIASGTTALEAMLLKRPMVIAYRLARLTYAIVSRMVKVRFVGLPNLLADKPLVPELLQERARPELICDEVMRFLDDDDAKNNLVAEFDAMHGNLKKNADRMAAEAISELVAQRQGLQFNGMNAAKAKEDSLG